MPRPRRSFPRINPQRALRLALGALQNPAISAIINQAAQANGLDPALVLAVAQKESGLNPNAVNPSSGAQGVMQLMPATARSLGVTNPFDPVQNINAGTRYLSQLIDQFSGDVVKGVAAYDWGPTSVKTAVNVYGPNWLYSAPAETQNYVQTILGISPAQVTSSEAPQQPMTIDASTGQVISEFPNVDQIPNVTPGIFPATILSTMPLQTKLILGAGALLAGVLLFDEIF